MYKILVKQIEIQIPLLDIYKFQEPIVINKAF